MEKLTILNDTHIGVIRNAGTTPASQWALRPHVLTKFKSLLPVSGDLMILGDLFNSSNVNVYDIAKTYEILTDWLSSTKGKLYLVAGNHDLSKTSTTLSSFEFLCNLLSKSYTERVVVVLQPTMTPYGYVIPHLANQDLFNAALEDVPETDFLFLHCNYDNNFAAQSDQSLNLSCEQALKLPVKTIVFGHEHKSRQLVAKSADKSVNILIPGNQIATSVADWQGCKYKQYLVIENGGFDTYTCAQASDEYAEMLWNDLEKTTHNFVKLVGTVNEDTEAETITALNRLRQIHEAFVVSYGVSIVSENRTAAFEAAAKTAKSFDIWEVLKEYLSEKEFDKALELNSRSV